jgi:hypothetical protein
MSSIRLFEESREHRRGISQRACLGVQAEWPDALPRPVVVPAAQAAPTRRGTRILRGQSCQRALVLRTQRMPIGRQIGVTQDRSGTDEGAPAQCRRSIAGGDSESVIRLAPLGCSRCLYHPPVVAKWLGHLHALDLSVRSALISRTPQSPPRARSRCAPASS